MIDLLVFIGRFQPFHNEHKRVIDVALEKAKHVLVLVGSAGSPRTVRNPFTFEERKNMIGGAYHIGEILNRDDGIPALIIEPLYDKTYNDVAWTKQVQHIVTETALDIVNKGAEYRNHGIGEMQIGLIGASKDHTSYYLKMFNQWNRNSIDVPLDFRMDASDIRRNYFYEILDDYVSEAVPTNVSNFLYGNGNNNAFWDTNEYTYISNEYTVIENYKESWKAAPYPVALTTVDAVVEQSGHILLVKRKASPGKGLLALPGGHLDVNKGERIIEGILRELREETCLKVPIPVLKGSIKEIRVFDDPMRSNLGRVITHAGYFTLEGQMELPRVKGADDAEKAFWIPIDQIREEEMFDDHYHIIQYFTRT